jgi:hypothetical protein
MFGNAPQRVRPERAIERGLVDQADGLVEISYPMAINSRLS